MIKLLIGSILAAAIAFIWNSLSWTVLDLHTDTMGKIKDEALATSLAEQMPDNLVYTFPYHDESVGTPSEQQEAFMKKSAAGPNILAFGRSGPGGKPMTAAMIWDFGTRLIGSFLIGLLLLSAKNLRYLGRAFFVALAGLFAALVTYIPLWTWFEFPAPFLRMLVLDQCVSWLLAGLVLALFVRENNTTSHA